MQPYSLDLRRRIVEAYLNKEGSQRQLAQRFSVSLGTVRNYLQLYRQTGGLAPRGCYELQCAKFARFAGLLSELPD